MGNEIICSFQNVTLNAGPPYEAPLTDLTLELAAGDMVLVDLGSRHLRFPLADVATGLLEPDSGAVFFLGQDWQAMFPADAAAYRGLIGRVFDERSWISNLDVDENITLAQRHHTGKSHEEVLAEAEELARGFGLEGVPPVRPAALGRRELRLAEWVRAFLGRPLLILLQDPLRGVGEDGLYTLLRGVQAARDRGAAVIWMTGDQQGFEDITPLATVRLKLEKTVLQRIGEGR